MYITPSACKLKAAKALRGRWITALLVVFCASLPITIVQLMSSNLINVYAIATPEQLLAAVAAIPQARVTQIGVASFLAFLLTPVLAVGCDWYLLRRLNGEELGIQGLFAKLRLFGRALWLYTQIVVRVWLWSLLLIVPGIMAALRYSQAPYLIAEDDSLTATQAIEKSKELMRDKKANLFLLELTFIGWVLGQLAVELLLGGVSVILALVASQFVSLFAATYLNASVAAFHQAVTTQTTRDAMERDVTNVTSRFAQGNRDEPKDDQHKGDDEP